ncbi:hypothetical protein IID24_05630 [Patescibacteria group bacterium]|nr:hypothetical protein [Patescibacteria group bacterium]
MDFSELQKRIVTIFEEGIARDKIPVNDDYYLMKLEEEVGELVQAYLVYKKQCRPDKYLSDEEAKKSVAKELSDVLALVFMISNALDIDFKEAIEKKWMTKEWLPKD